MTIRKPRMNGRHLLLILAHLFRKKGGTMDIEDAVEFLSFRCRYARPSVVRRMLTLALSKGMIEIDDDQIKSNFLFDQQDLSPNQVHIFKQEISVDRSVKPLR
ncbi:DUF2240 family protein [Candidatus Thorarchaeota archaeon]|nr:MAG: DUF2240 family protein [Candidatus Thorarchaeota archaeon]